jgi:hypothetical protein
VQKLQKIDSEKRKVDFDERRKQKTIEVIEIKEVATIPTVTEPKPHSKSEILQQFVRLSEIRQL